MKPSNNAISNSYSEPSHAWDIKIRKLIPNYQSMHELAQNFLETGLSESAKVLISGVGTGYEAGLYAMKNTKWSITGFDPAEGMLSEAIHRMDEFELQNRIRLILGKITDIENIPIYDACTSILVNHFIPDNGEKLDYLSNIAQKLKRNGKIILVDLEGDRNTKEFQFLMSIWKTHQLKYRDDKEKVEKDFTSIDKTVHFIPQARIEALLQEAGFTRVIKFYQTYLVAGYSAVKL